MLVLLIFPLWSNALFEKMVIRFDRKVGAGSDIVLEKYQRV